MAISPQLPQIVAAARSGTLQALALQPGQMLEAQVIGPAPNGGTQVQIAGQMLNLLLTTPVKAGETLKLQVQGSGAQLKLALQPKPPASIPLQAARPLPVPMGQANPPLPAAQSALPLLPLTSTSQVATASPVVPTPAPSGFPLVPVGDAVPRANVAPPRSLAPQTQPTASLTPISAAPAAAATRISLAGALRPGQSTVTIPPEMPATAPSSSATVLPAPPRNPPASPYLQSSTAQPATRMSPGAPPLVPMAVQVNPAPDAALRTHAPAAPAAPIVAPSMASQPVTPQAALAHMVQSALPRQDSVAGLMTALTAIAGKVALPEPVLRAAQQILAGRVVLDRGKLDGATVQKAVLNSGIFQEASLARGQVPGAPSDQKSALLALHRTLTNWLGPQQALTPATHIAPPLRGQVPRARTSEPAPVDAEAAPQEIGKQLLERTEASLSRLRLHQNASLPDPVAKTTAEWSMDLPVLIGTHQSVLQLQIHRDGPSPAPAPAERGWQMRFALSMPQMGEVGAQVSLRGGATGVMLWASERQTSDALETHLLALRQTLAELGLRPGAVIVRHGEPPAPARTASGHFVDART